MEPAQPERLTEGNWGKKQSRGRGSQSTKNQGEKTRSATTYYKKEGQILQKYAGSSEGQAAEEAEKNICVSNCVKKAHKGEGREQAITLEILVTLCRTTT